MPSQAVGRLSRRQWLRLYLLPLVDIFRPLSYQRRIACLRQSAAGFPRRPFLQAFRFTERDHARIRRGYCGWCGREGQIRASREKAEDAQGITQLSAIFTQERIRIHSAPPIGLRLGCEGRETNPFAAQNTANRRSMRPSLSASAWPSKLETTAPGFTPARAKPSVSAFGSACAMKSL